MAGGPTKEQLQKDIAVWFADGIIEKHALDILSERYEARRFGWIGVIKYLGITGGLLAFFGIIGLVTAMTESAGFGAVVLGCVGGGLTYWGLRLAAFPPLLEARLAARATWQGRCHIDAKAIK